MTQKPPTWPDRLVGLTGGIASGKSSVTSFLRSCGFDLYSADEWAREAVVAGSRTLAMLEKEYGPGILSADGSLDRQKLLAILLSSPDEKARIEQIIHPEVLRLMDRDLAAARKKSVDTVVVEVPLLYETGIEKLFDMVAVVTAPFEERLRRVMKRNGTGEDIARKWLETQMPQEEKAAMADVVIANNGTLEELGQEVRNFAERIRRL
jgi:dephospho-CoA kinase